MVIGAPSDENECRQMLYTAYQHPGPAVVRYPRGTGPGAIIADTMVQMEIGRAVEVRRGERVAILNFGTLLPQAMAAAKQLNATVVDMRWVKPMDEAKVLELAGHYDLLVTLEESAVAGGAGSSVNELLVAQAQQTAVINLGIPDEFVEHGAHQEQLSWIGLDSDSIVRRIRKAMHTHRIPMLSTLDIRGPVELPR
jgi:1-deoxy-D-xylulose-5-phosphate synthase